MEVLRFGPNGLRDGISAHVRNVPSGDGLGIQAMFAMEIEGRTQRTKERQLGG